MALLLLLGVLLAACAGPVSQPTALLQPTWILSQTATVVPEATLPATVPPTAMPTPSPSTAEEQLSITADNAAEIVAVYTLEGHAADVNSVAFSPDGSLLASGSSDGRGRLWRTDDGSLLHILEAHSD